MNDTLSQRVLGLSNAYNNPEIAEILEISREEVRQILLNFGVINNRYPSNSRSMFLYLQKFGKNISNKDIGEKFKVSPETVGDARRKLGMKNVHEYAEDNCRKCLENPYAKGLCRVHYNKKRRNL